MSFGEFVKQKRLETKLSLRSFCSAAGFDPSNWSKIERGVLPAPDSLEQLENITKVLKIQERSKDWYKLINLASISKNKIPHYVLNNEEVLDALPIFFRRANGERPSEEELNKIIELLKGA
jgi:transcriptional regulator with XRE-family HTH domain